MSASDERPAALADHPARRTGPGALGACAVALGLVCAVCLALLLVLTWARVDPWDGLTVVPWFAFPVAFLLFCGSLARSARRRRRA